MIVDGNGAPGDLFGGGGPSVFGAGGTGVDVDGDVMVVGSMADDVGGDVDEGSATVFRFDGVAWVEEAELVSSNGTAGDAFGVSVSISGDVIVAGRPLDNLSGQPDQGSARVYRFDGTEWDEEAELVSSTGVTGDEFGVSVAVSDDVIVVGAPRVNSGGLDDAGSVTVFRFDGSDWIEEAELVASAGAARDGFGRAVSVSGDVIVVGTALDDVGGAANRGSATVFRWDGAAWQQEQQLFAQDGEAYDQFGFSVSVDGDVIVVGSVLDDVGGNAFQGSATVFRWSGTTWFQQQELTAADGAAFDQFGVSVSLSGDTIVVGAGGADAGGQINSGSATVFRWNGSKWLEDDRLVADAGADSDLLGTSVAVAGSTIVAAAPFRDVNGAANRGAVFLFDEATNAWGDQGGALGGITGDPLLVGCGDLSDEDVNSIELSNCAAQAITALFFAFSSTPVPFKGGTLMTFPFLPPVFLATSSTGRIPLVLSVPESIPSGTEIWIQCAIQDSAAVFGVALSNAIMGVRP